MIINRRALALGLLLVPVLTPASDPANCDDLKYVGTNKLGVLVGIQDANPAYRACVLTTKFNRASKDLDDAYRTTAITDDDFRAQVRELNRSRGELGYEKVTTYSNITTRAFKSVGSTQNKSSGSSLSFGYLSKPISTAPGYMTISGDK